MLTQKELKSLVHYDPKTGIFTRKVTTSSRGLKGKRADEVNDCKRYYSRICLKGRRYFAARVAFLYVTGEWPKKFVDHINRNRKDNRWCNLRETNNKYNMLNASDLKNNTSGIKGVAWHKQLHKWRAFIFIDQKQYHLGITTKLSEAACLRFAAEQCLGIDKWAFDSSAEKFVKSFI